MSKRARVEDTAESKYSPTEELFLFLGTHFTTMSTQAFKEIATFINDHKASIQPKSFLDALSKVNLSKELSICGSFQNHNLALFLYCESECVCESLPKRVVNGIAFKEFLASQRLHYNQEDRYFGGDIVIKFNATPASHCLETAKKHADTLAEMCRDANRNVIVYGAPFHPACVVGPDHKVLYAPAEPVKRGVDCVVCMKRERNRFPEACKHLCVCEECAATLTRCPICKCDNVKWCSVFIS